jgi:hypothetical protein
MPLRVSAPGPCLRIQLIAGGPFTEVRSNNRCLSSRRWGPVHPELPTNEVSMPQVR